MNKVGVISQIIGPVLDVLFQSSPLVLNEMSVGQVTLEVQQLIGNHMVRAVAMNSTEGLKRGMEVIDTGHAMTVPVGSFVLGRIFNVLGIPIDQSVSNEELGVVMHQLPEVAIHRAGLAHVLFPLEMFVSRIYKIHHIWIGGFCIVGAATHASISIIRSVPTVGLVDCIRKVETNTLCK